MRSRYKLPKDIYFATPAPLLMIFRKPRGIVTVEVDATGASADAGVCAADYDKKTYIKENVNSLTSTDSDDPKRKLPSEKDLELSGSGDDDDDEEPEFQLQQSLKSRHIQLIALGGAIGTGLFVGTSGTLRTCGPAGLFISYCIISTVIYPVMQAFGEMVCYLPGDGHDSAGSCAHLVSKYLDKSLGFATGWNYYYCYVILVAAECSAASSVVEYWTTAVPKAVWITIFLAIIVALNFCAVKFYGETEFWFASIKIICILGLIILSFILFWGGGPSHDRLGFRYWQRPGAFAHHVGHGSNARFADIWTGVIKGGFAFILGPELISLTSSECEDQRRNIAKASRRYVWRLVFFYILGALSISVIVAYNDPTLVNALNQGKPGAGSSPFVIGIQNAGIKGLPHVINACILTSAWSAGNAFMFASSRSLLTMAKNGQAPRIFAKINRYGVPYVAVLFSLGISCLSYLNSSTSTAQVFDWFSNISTISGFIGWIMACIAYLRFRRAIDHFGMLHRLPYRSKGMPHMVWYSLIIVSLITLTNGYIVFVPGRWNKNDFVAAYITLPIFVTLWLGHKIWNREWRRWYIPVSEIDVQTGVEEIEEKTRELDEKRIPPNSFWDKFLDALL